MRLMHALFVASPCAAGSCCELWVFWEEESLGPYWGQGALLAEVALVGFQISSAPNELDKWIGGGGGGGGGGRFGAGVGGRGDLILILDEALG